MLKSGKFLSFLVALISLQIITSFYQSSLDTSFQYHNSQHLSLCSCHFSIIIDLTLNIYSIHGTPELLVTTRNSFSNHATQSSSLAGSPAPTGNWPPPAAPCRPDQTGLPAEISVHCGQYSVQYSSRNRLQCRLLLFISGQLPE